MTFAEELPALWESRARRPSAMRAYLAGLDRTLTPHELEVAAALLGTAAVELRQALADDRAASAGAQLRQASEEAREEREQRRSNGRN